MIAPHTTYSSDTGRHHRQGETPFGEMCRLAELYPTHSLLQVLELIDRELWDIEVPNQDQRTAYGRINAKTILDRLCRSMIGGMQIEFPLDAPPRVRQWLPSGAHLCLPKLLDEDTVARLVSHCDALLRVPGTAPIRLFEHLGVLDDATIADIAKAALAALPKPLAPHCKPAVLKKRVLLRRTFPPSQLPARIGNANNQFWHQDSNARYNDSVMLTLWIPLHDGSGTTCPGLQLINAPVSYFSILYGDSARDVYPVLREMFPETRIVSIEASAGDCVLINGLTFHQTSTLPTMTRCRDALLVRVIDSEAAHLFGVEDPQTELLALG